LAEKNLAGKKLAELLAATLTGTRNHAVFEKKKKIEKKKNCSTL
jgi:hypothetical protein